MNGLVNDRFCDYAPISWRTFITHTTEAARTYPIPRDRFGDPDDDLNGAVILLASPATSYVTGQVLYVDGEAISAY